MAKHELRDIAPAAADHPEAVFATLYAAHLSFADNERRLIWNRFSGFLVLEGLLLGAVARDFGVATPFLLLTLSAIGGVLSIVWLVLNFSGWLNQNRWLTFAARFNFTHLKTPLLSDFWRDTRALRPFGTVYRIAQSVPFCFLLVYAAVAGYAIYLISSILVWAITGAVCAACVGGFVAWVLICQLYRDRKDEEDDRPFC